MASDIRNTTAATRSMPSASVRNAQPPGPLMRKKRQVPNFKYMRCLHCNVTESRLWRTGPDGTRTLCGDCFEQYVSGQVLLYQSAEGALSVVPRSDWEPVAVVAFQRIAPRLRHMRPLVQPVSVHMHSASQPEWLIRPGRLPLITPVQSTPVTSGPPKASPVRSGEGPNSSDAISVSSGSSGGSADSSEGSSESSSSASDMSSGSSDSSEASSVSSDTSSDASPSGSESPLASSILEEARESLKSTRKRTRGASAASGISAGPEKRRKSSLQVENAAPLTRSQDHAVCTADANISTARPCSGHCLCPPKGQGAEGFHGDAKQKHYVAASPWDAAGQSMPLVGTACPAQCVEPAAVTQTIKREEIIGNSTLTAKQLSGSRVSGSPAELLERAATCPEVAVKLEDVPVTRRDNATNPLGSREDREVHSAVRVGQRPMHSQIVDNAERSIGICDNPGGITPSFVADAGKSALSTDFRRRRLLCFPRAPIANPRVDKPLSRAASERMPVLQVAKVEGVVAVPRAAPPAVFEKRTQLPSSDSGGTTNTVEKLASQSALAGYAEQVENADVEEMISVKASYKSGDARKTHRFTVKHGLTYGFFVTLVQEMFDVKTRLMISYKDEEGDNVTVASDNEMRELFAVVRQYNLSPVRIQIASIGEF